MNPVIGKELGSIHNSTLQFRFFGIDFWNAPIPTPLVELGGWLQLQFHGIGGIPRDSTSLNFPLPNQVSLAVLKNTSDTWFTSFFNFFNWFQNKHWNPLESPQFRWIGVGVVAPIPRLEFELGVNSNSEICKRNWNWNWWNCSNDWLKFRKSVNDLIWQISCELTKTQPL